MLPKIGEIIQIQSYKHDEALHRIWETANVVDVDDEKIVVVNKRTKVIEANGRFWYAKEPSVTWFYAKRWFNIIGILKRDGIAFYCNIASPFIYDEEGLKYIDYDLDVKVLVDNSYTTLDRNEYNRHKEKMDYPDDLKVILEKELKLLKEMIDQKLSPFDKDSVMKYYNEYLEDTKE